MTNVRIACLAVLSLAAWASASSLGARFPSFQGAVQSKLGSLPTTGLTKDQTKARAALTASLKALAKDSKTLRADLASAGKALAPLHARALLADAVALRADETAAA